MSDKLHNLQQTFYSKTLALRVELSLKGLRQATDKDGFFFTIAPAKGDGTKHIDWDKQVVVKYSLAEMTSLLTALQIINREIFFKNSNRSLEAFHLFVSNYFNNPSFKNMLFVHKTPNKQTTTGLEVWQKDSQIGVAFSIDKTRFIIPKVNLIPLQYTLQKFIDIGLQRNQD